MGSIFIYLGILFIFLFILDLENYQPSLSIIAMKVIASFLPFTGLIGLFLLASTTSKIITSSQGIELHQFGFCVRVIASNE